MNDKYLSNYFYYVFKYIQTQLKNNKHINVKSCELVFNDENEVERINFKYSSDNKEVIVSDIYNKKIRIVFINYDTSKFKYYNIF